MLDYIAMYPNAHESELNMDFLTSAYDKDLDYYAIACMKDLESIENIEILDIKIIEDQDDVDINQHMVNINYKKKDLDSIPIPKNLYMMDSRYHEIQFKIRVHTNLNEKIFIKRILVPTEHDGYYLINNKKIFLIINMIFMAQTIMQKIGIIKTIMRLSFVILMATTLFKIMQQLQLQ